MGQPQNAPQYKKIDSAESKSHLKKAIRKLALDDAKKYISSIATPRGGE